MPGIIYKMTAKFEIFFNSIDHRTVIISIVCTLIDNSYEPISMQEF